MFGIGKLEELIVVLIIILVLFGAKKLPQLSRSIAESVKEVRNGFRDNDTATQARQEAKQQDKA